MRKLNRRRRGAALVEYGLIIAGVALVCAAAVAVFGHKTSDLIAAVASVLPGAHSDDNGAIVSGKIIETTRVAGTNGITIDATAIQNNAGAGTRSLGNNVLGGSQGGNDFGGLVTEPN